MGKQEMYTIHNASPGSFWSVTGANPSNQISDSSFVVNWQSAGTYRISCKHDSLGQIVISHLQVSVHALPFPYIKPLQSNICIYNLGPKSTIQSFAISSAATSDLCYAVCDSGWYSFSVYGQPGSTFTWYTGAGDTVKSNVHGDTVQVHWIGLGQRTLYCTETNIYGCQNSSNICINVIEKPKACITSYPQDSSGIVRVCKGTGITFSDACSSAPVGSAIVSRKWILGDGNIVDDMDIVNYAYNIAGTYNLKYVVESDCHCSDTFHLTVVVDTGVGPGIFCISTTCGDSIGTYFTHDTCSLGYTWSISGGTITHNMGDTISVKWGNGNNGYGSLTLKTNCTGSCPYATQTYVPIVPENAAISGPQVVCANETDLYTVPFVPSTVYTWYKGGNLNTPVPNNNTNQIQYLWRSTSSGTDTLRVKYYNPFLKCGGMSTIVVTIAPGYYISGSTQVCQSSIDTFKSIIASSGPAVKCNWGIYPYAGGAAIDTLTGDSLFIPHFTTAGVYKILAYPYTDILCGAPQQILVTVFGLPPAPTNPVIGSDTVCTGNVYSYFSSPNSTSYYLEWSTYNGTPATGVGNQIQVAWSAPFNDTLYVRNVMIDDPGCGSVWHKEIIYPLPNPHVEITGDTATCSDQIEAYATAFTADSYTWSVSPPSAGSVSIGNSSKSISVQWNHTDTTVHARVILAIQKCSQTFLDTIAVTVHPVPALTLSIDSPACVGNAVNMSVSPAGTSVDWNFGDGSAHGTSASLTHSYSSDRSYTVLVTVVSPGGCSVTESAAKTFSVYPTPAAVLSSPDATTHCINTIWSDTLYTTLQNIGNVGITYQLYDNGSPVGSPGTSGTYIVTAVGSYTVHVVSAAGCSVFTPALTVRIDSCLPPTGGGSCSTSDTIGFSVYQSCGTAVLTAHPSAGARFDSWLIFDPAQVTVHTNPYTYTFPKAGFYAVYVNGFGAPASGTDSCPISSTHTVTVPLVAAFDVFYQCDGNVLKTKLVDISTYVLDSVAHREWYIDGTLVSSARDPLLTVASGAHTFRLKVWNNRDTCEITRTDTVPAQPHASFTTGDSICEGQPVHFVSTSTPSADIISYLWGYDDRASSTLNPSDRAYQVATVNSFTYHPSLFITDKYGCVDSVSHPVTIFKNQMGSYAFCLNPSLLTGCQGSTDTIQLMASETFNCLDPSRQVVFSQYSWSNGDMTYNDPFLTVSQTGSYYVTVSDGYGCQLPYSNPALVIFNAIHGQITGDTIYCIGDKTYLNIFSGRGYTYSWLVQSSPSFPPDAVSNNTGLPYELMQSVDVSMDGTRYWGVIFDPASGCSDTVGPLTIHVYPAVSSSFGYTSSSVPPCVDKATVTLSVSSTVADYFLWSTGVVGNSIVVSTPGSYKVSMIDSNGCDAMDTTILIKSGPDFTELIFGCYKKCIGDTLQVQGPPPPTIRDVVSYQWLEDGVPLSSTYTLNSGRDINAWGRYGSHVYRLIMTVNGCTDTSNVIDVDFITCPERNTCIDVDSTYISCQNCIEDTTHGERHYSIVLYVHYTGTSVAHPIQVLPADTNIHIDRFYPDYINPVSMHGGWNTISVSATDVSPYSSRYCILLRVSDACQYTYCFEPSSVCRKH